VKVFLYNSPHNPTGKNFTAAEVEEISTILQEFPDVKVISDEVYDFLTFDGRKHIPFASLHDNWKRTVSVYSGGKLFNATGWKLGWCIGPQDLIYKAGVISNTVFYTGNTPGQVAMARSLPKVFSKDL
jgi:aspartate/methionine/tyrosine aminotransferase